MLNGFARLLLNNRRAVLISMVLLAGLSGVYAYQFARINSDLGTLIKPSPELAWFQQNEQFKRQFPMFEQTALVVVSGKTYSQVLHNARQIVDSLKSDNAFKDVFAPSIEGFAAEHRAYFLEPLELSTWLRGVDYNYGPMLRMADESSVPNLLYTLGDHLSSNRGLPLPTLLETLVGALVVRLEQVIEGRQTQSVQDADQLITGQKFGAPGAEVSAFPALVDPDAEIYHEIIVVRGWPDLAAQLPNAKIVEKLNQHVESIAIHPDVLVRLTGEVPLAHEEISAALSGVELAGMISVLLLMVILGVGIRSVGFVLSIFILLVLGVLMTLGLAVAVVGSFNTLSLIFVIMFFGLGVDFAVHFGLRITEALGDADYADAFSEALSDIGPALLLCMLTSSIAFLSFLPTAYIGLAELGMISALGMMVAFCLTVVLLPVLLSYVRHANWRYDGRGKKRFMSLPSLAAKPVVAVSILFIVLGLWTAKDMQFDYSVLAMRDVQTPGMQALLDLQDAGLTTDYSIAVVAKDRMSARQLVKELESIDLVGNVLSPDQIFPSDQLQKYEQLQRQFARFDGIDEVLEGEVSTRNEVLSALNYMQESLKFAQPAELEQVNRLVKQLHSLSDEEWFSINEQVNAEMNQQLVRGLQQVRQVLNAKPFTIDGVPDSLLRRFITADEEYLLRVQPKVELTDREATTHFITAVKEAVPNIAGRSVVEWGIGSVVVEAFIQASVTALVGIFLVLIVFFRGIVLPTLVLVPILVSLVLTFAVCQWVGISLNMANILVVPLIIGLGVDTGIHVVHRMMSVGSDALFRSSTGRAVLISALTTVGTFISLSFSPHLGAASIGLLLSIAISLLVMVTFVLLPALIQLLGLARVNAVQNDELPTYKKRGTA